MTKFGLALPTMRAGAGREVIEAAADAAERLGWASVWTTDHVLVPRSNAREYGRIFEAITTLAWIGGRHPGVRLGTSVIVVPQRNAVVLAKELATLDALSGGRLLAGVGVGWNETEFANLGAEDRFHRRGAYLDETIRLWRHLWAGSSEPFDGAFHRLRDFAFEPLPEQGAALPVIVGGRSPAALRRAGSLGDGFQSTGLGPDEYARVVPGIRAASEAAGRPMPSLSARLTARFDGPADGPSVLAGGPSAMIERIRAYAALGVEEIVVAFDERDPGTFSAVVERFDTEVVRAMGDASAGSATT